MAPSSEVTQVVNQLRKLATKDVAATAKRRGIPPSKLLGVGTADIRKTAKTMTGDLRLAEALWASEYHEAKLLAVLLHPPKAVSQARLHRWVVDIYSWDLCDHFCKHLALRSADVMGLIATWSRRRELYVRRAALALIANYCMRSDSLTDVQLEALVGHITDTSSDDRKHVRQACCWALRELGKIDDAAHDKAIHAALEMLESDDKNTVWVGRCAYRELENLVKVPQRRRLLTRKSKTGAGLTEKEAEDVR